MKKIIILSFILFTSIVLSQDNPKYRSYEIMYYFEEALQNRVLIKFLDLGSPRSPYKSNVPIKRVHQLSQTSNPNETAYSFVKFEAEYIDETSDISTLTITPIKMYKGDQFYMKIDVEFYGDSPILYIEQLASPNETKVTVKENFMDGTAKGHSFIIPRNTKSFAKHLFE